MVTLVDGRTECEDGARILETEFTISAMLHASPIPLLTDGVFFHQRHHYQSNGLHFKASPVTIQGVCAGSTQSPQSLSMLAHFVFTLTKDDLGWLSPDGCNESSIPKKTKNWQIFSQQVDSCLRRIYPRATSVVNPPSSSSSIVKIIQIIQAIQSS